MTLKKLLISFALLIIVLAGATALAADWVGVVTKDSAVYASASASAKKLGSLKKSQYVYVQSWKDGWAKVTLNGNVGYMPLSCLNKTTRKAYVTSAKTKIYESNSTSSKLLGTYAFGMECELEAVYGSWARIVSGKKTGYCKMSDLSFTNPNNQKLTVYTQSNSVKVYAYPDSSANVLCTVGANVKLKCVATINGTWCRVLNGSNVGFIKKSDLDTKKYDGYSTARMAGGEVHEADWWKSSIRNIFARGTTAIVTDVETGITWRVYRGGGTNHADVQPLTAADTAAMKKACGSDYGTWTRRAIWVSVDGKRYAASMNCMPHGDGSITNNNFNGHYCIHFTNSRTHGSNSICPLHQACIKKALKAG